MVAQRKQRTPEQKEARKAQDRLYYEAKKAGKTIVPRPPKMTEEERKLRAAERQRINRAKAREGKPDGRTREAKGCVVLHKPNLGRPVQVAPKTYSRANPRPAPKRLPDLLPDPTKVKVRLDRRTEVFASPGYDIVQLRAKYGIAV